MNFSIELTQAESKALSYVAHDPLEWMTNFTKERCRIAIEEIVKICVNKCVDVGMQIPSTKEAMVDLAFEQGWVVPASEAVGVDLSTIPPTL